MATQWAFECWCSPDGGLDYNRHYEITGEDAVCDMPCMGDEVLQTSPQIAVVYTVYDYYCCCIVLLSRVHRSSKVAKGAFGVRSRARRDVQSCRAVYRLMSEYKPNVGTSEKSLINFNFGNRKNCSCRFMRAIVLSRVTLPSLLTLFSVPNVRRVRRLRTLQARAVVFGVLDSSRGLRAGM